MFTNIMLLGLVVIIGVSCYYESQRNIKKKELHILEMSNLRKESKLLDIQIEDQNIRLKYLKKVDSSSDKVEK